MASNHSSEITNSNSDRILSYAGKHVFCLLSNGRITSCLETFVQLQSLLVPTAKYCCLIIHGLDAYYCSLEAIAKIEGIPNPYGKIASKLRFVAVVLYKTTKVAASKVGHASAAIMT